MWRTLVKYVVKTLFDSQFKPTSAMFNDAINIII